MTKKRWHVGCGNGEGAIFADEGRMALGPRGTTLTPICTVYDFEGDREENLRLIAAAPEFLDALRSAELSCTQACLANGIGKKTQAAQITFLLASFDRLQKEIRVAIDKANLPSLE